MNWIISHHMPPYRLSNPYKICLEKKSNSLFYFTAFLQTYILYNKFISSFEERRAKEPCYTELENNLQFLHLWKILVKNLFFETDFRSMSIGVYHDNNYHTLKLQRKN